MRTLVIRGSDKKLGNERVEPWLCSFAIPYNNPVQSKILMFLVYHWMTFVNNQRFKIYKCIWWAKSRFQSLFVVADFLSDPRVTKILICSLTYPLFFSSDRSRSSAWNRKKWTKALLLLLWGQTDTNVKLQRFCCLTSIICPNQIFTIGNVCGSFT